MNDPIRISRLKDFWKTKLGQKLFLHIHNREEIYAGQDLEHSCSPACPSNQLLSCEVTVQKEGDIIIERRYMIPVSPTNMYASRMDRLENPRVRIITEENTRWELYKKLTAA